MAEFSAIAEDNEVLEPGEYPAIFRGVEAPDEPGLYGLYIEASFDALTEDGPVRVTGRASRPERYTRSTKARLWYEAVDGRPQIIDHAGLKLDSAQSRGGPGDEQGKQPLGYPDLLNLGRHRRGEVQDVGAGRGHDLKGKGL